MSLVGKRLPDVELGFMQGDTCVNKKLSEIIGMDRTFLFGVPQAFSPICSNNHLPVIIQNFDGFIKANFEQVCIIAPGQPLGVERMEATVRSAFRTQVFSRWES